MIDPLMGPGLPLSTPGIQPEDSIMVAGRKVWRFLLAEMLSHEEGTRNGEDIEALHDMRVATRRMRAAFDVFGNAFDKGTLTPHLKGLRLTGRILGKVRDLDVFLEKAGIYLSDLAESERHGLDPLLENWQLQRQVARQEMLAYLESKEYLRFVKRFNNFLEINETQPTSYLPHPGDNEIPHPVQVQLLAPVMIYQRLAEVRAFDNILVFASVEQLHMLRIQFKKLRYSVEFFQETLGKEAQSIIDNLKKIQDHLGNLHDAVVICELLRTFLKNLPKQQYLLPVYQQRDNSGIMVYLSHSYAERQLLIAQFPERWKWFMREEFRKNLASAISIL